MHWPLHLVFVRMTHTQALLPFLETRGRGSGLQRGQIHRISLHQPLRHCEDIRDEPIQEVEAHALAHDHAEDLGFPTIGREGVVGDDVLFRAEDVGDAFLLDVGVVLSEVVREVERHHRETGVVISAGLVFPSKVDLVQVLQLVFAPRAMNVGDALVPAGGFERFAEQARVGQAIFHNGVEAVKAQVD